MRQLLRKSLRWALFISFLSGTLAIILSSTSTTILSGLNWLGGIFVLFLIVLAGVSSDMLGVAATAADEKPFHAMAARKVSGARETIGIIRRADQFSNITADVIGDISGVLSGAAAFAVVSALIASFPMWSTGRWALDIASVSLISAFTVGGKAIGKSIGIHYANTIIFQIGKMFYFINKKFHLQLFVRNTKKKRKRKRGGLGAPRAD